MHASSLENMSRCYAKHIVPYLRSIPDRRYKVLDIGGANVNGSYRQIFPVSNFDYAAADIAAGEGVDVVLDDPYCFPFESGSIDVVISGQAFEHIECFWRTFEEMARILEPGGWIFLIMPSAGPKHRYPVDCYRFYPDALSALAKHGNVHLVGQWLDTRGPWKDLVGVFKKQVDADAQQIPKSYPQATLTAGCAYLEVSEGGSTEQEQIKGEIPYLDFLNRMHRIIKPEFYAEFGIRNGDSLKLARCKAIGVDPAPNINTVLNNETQVFECDSDVFFDYYADRAFEGRVAKLGFIDGMHLFEYALRDFIALESRSSPSGIIIFDDIYPCHPAQAKRVRESRVWTGDIWKIMSCLAKYRPDLILIPVNTSPTGLLLVMGLNPKSKLLWENYNPIVREFTLELSELPPDEVLARSGAWSASDQRLERVLDYLSAKEVAQNDPVTLQAALRDLVAQPVRVASSKLIAKPVLSVIVVCYNMEREIPRTLKSLSVSMQLDIAEKDYEVILIDNGSSKQIDPAIYQSLCPNLRVETIKNPSKSPVKALNLGISLARGELIGAMIDGARIASPRLLSQAILAQRLHHRAVISSLGFHLGPDVQVRSIHSGYNQAVEDALLDGLNWEDDGYCLYDIAVFAGSSNKGWFSNITESNALFMVRSMWDELGGYDASFTSPGGGLVNLDTYDRACKLPDSQLVVLLGEGTFHQVHGGIATNSLTDRWPIFDAEYRQIRGKSFEKPSIVPVYLGKINPHVLRSLKLSAELAMV